MEIQTRAQPENRKKQNKDYWKLMFKQFQPKYLLMAQKKKKKRNDRMFCKEELDPLIA